MRYKVPQNIDMPDRILGPLTMLQFVYAVVGGGLAYVSFVSLPSPLSTMLAVIVALLTAAIIFLKINERPFTHFLMSFFQFLSSPKSRVWRKGEDSDLSVEIYHSKKKGDQNQVGQKNIRSDQIEQLAKKLDAK